MSDPTPLPSPADLRTATLEGQQRADRADRERITTTLQQAAANGRYEATLTLTFDRRSELTAAGYHLTPLVPDANPLQTAQYSATPPLPTFLVSWAPHTQGDTA